MCQVKGRKEKPDALREVRISRQGMVKVWWDVQAPSSLNSSEARYYLFFRKSFLFGSCLLVGGAASKSSKAVSSLSQINLSLLHYGICSSLNKRQ